VMDAGGALLPGRAVTWASSNVAVATVSATGVVTGRAAGTATISASSGGKSGSATVTVVPVPVGSLSIAPPAATLVPSQVVVLTSIVRDANNVVVNDRSVTWTSSNTAVATVAPNGTLTALAVGTAAITATSEGKTGASAITVVTMPVGSVVVSPPSATATAGNTVTLSATVRDTSGVIITGRVVTWSSSDATIVTVSSAGVVSGVAPGTAVITAASEGKSGTSTITVLAPAIASVGLQPTTASVQVGGSTTLTATVTDANSAVVTDRPITWFSSNLSVATVSPTGVVTGRAVGTATISATSGGKTGSATVNVVPVPVGSVAVTPPAATLVPTQLVSLNAVVRDANNAIVTDRSVVWATSNAAVATVSANGTVTAVAVGTATITATSEGRSGQASITVTPMPVASISVAPGSASLDVDGTATLVATTKSADGTVLTGRTVTWSSDAPGVATVSSSGVVTAVAPGVATITATSEGISATAAITVNRRPVGSVVVHPTSATVTIGQPVTLEATVSDAAGVVVTDRVVTWTSSDINVAVVSATGVVSGVAPGTTTISATSEGKTGTSAITVVAPAIASVDVQPTTASVLVGGTTALTATVKDVNGTVVTDSAVVWTSNNVAVATVSATGVVTGQALGVVTISATSGGKFGSATVNVAPVPVSSVAVSPSTATLVPTQVLTLDAVVRDANNTVVTDRVVTWTSSNPAVATVSANGTVTAIAAGTATVTATSEGRTGTSAITVVPMSVASVTVDPSSTSVTAGNTVALSATVRDTSGAIATGRTVTWSSSDPDIATVSGAGVVMGMSPGTVTITATSEGKSGQASVTVTPPPVASVTLTPGSLTLNPGQTSTLTATTKSAGGTVLTGRVVTFSSDNVSVASVSSNGVVTGVATGTATITATSEGQSATATVTVQPAVASVVVAPSSVFVKKNGTVQFSVTAYDADGHKITGRTVTWASSDTRLATVNGSGLVSALRTGTVTITATIEGKSDSSQVTITN
jgi:uncharacterized protein YjdB